MTTLLREEAEEESCGFVEGRAENKKGSVTDLSEHDGAYARGAARGGRVTVRSSTNLHQKRSSSLAHSQPSVDSPTSRVPIFSAYLGDNSFASLPSDFFDGLSSLQIFSIENDKNLKPWTLPPGLKKAVVLQQFYVNNASVKGSIPDFLGNGSMPSLQHLELAFNNLTGTISASFNTSGIMSLHLNNQNGRLLGGRIDVFGGMQSLTEVYLQVNSFTCPILVASGSGMKWLREMS